MSTQVVHDYADDDTRIEALTCSYVVARDTTAFLNVLHILTPQSDPLSLSIHIALHHVIS